MENRTLRSFWFGFIFTVALTAWVYWIWRQKRVVAPKPLVVSGTQPSRTRSTNMMPATTAEGVLDSDDLEEINGIGPVFANRLNEAGIYTFAQLALSEPDQLKEITGVTRWDPEDWISQAARLNERGIPG
jgi:predicted flap endonuclease-1-like 5' DNA nuclease